MSEQEETRQEPSELFIAIDELGEKIIDSMASSFNADEKDFLFGGNRTHNVADALYEMASSFNQLENIKYIGETIVFLAEKIDKYSGDYYDYNAADKIEDAINRVSTAIENSFISPAVNGKDGRNANVVDAIAMLADAGNRIAAALERQNS